MRQAKPLILLTIYERNGLRSCSRPARRPARGAHRTGGAALVGDEAGRQGEGRRVDPPPGGTPPTGPRPPGWRSLPQIALPVYTLQTAQKANIHRRLIAQTANMHRRLIAQIDKLRWTRALTTAEEIGFLPYWRLTKQAVTRPHQIGLVKILRIPRTPRYTSCPTPVACATVRPMQQPRSHRRGRSAYLSA